MRDHLLGLLLFFTLQLFSCKQDIPSGSLGKSERTEVENAIHAKAYFEGDTVSLHTNLDSLLEIAEFKRSIPLKWAYYQRMADGFSMAFDGVNSRSDHYYRKAEDLVRNTRYDGLRQAGMIREGHYYFVYREISKALPCFLAADELRKKVKASDLPLFAKHYGYISGFYSFIGNHRKAAEYLQDALPHTNGMGRERIDMLNSIGLFLERDSMANEARGYYNLAIGEAAKTKDSVWIGIISGNIATIEWDKGNYQQALELTKKNIEYSYRFNEPIDAMRANLGMATMYAQLSSWDSAQVYAERALEEMEDKPYFLPYRTDAQKLLSEIAGANSDWRGELRHLKEYLSLNDRMEQMREEQKVREVSWEWEAKRYQDAKQTDELRREQKDWIYMIALFSILLLFTVLILLVKSSRDRAMIRNSELIKEGQLLSGQVKLAHSELAVLKDSLQEFADTVKQNDLTIGRLRNEVLENLDSFPEKRQQFSDSMDRLVESQVMTPERWEKFMGIFQRVYPGYLDNYLQGDKPIGDGDFKLLALTKIGLTNRNIADLLGISLEGVKKAKQRLRKKLEMDGGSPF